MAGVIVMLTLLEVLERSDRYLADRAVPHARREAEILMAHVLKLERILLYVQHDRPMIDAELELLRTLLGRRGKREPLGWILGQIGFHDIELQTHPGVLVPRPDTETLVEAALALIPTDRPCFVADVGTGTGAVGLAIAAARANVRVYATDLSVEALSCARANVEALGLGDRVAILRGDLLAPIPPNRPIDLVVSNPPYIPTATIDGLEPEVSRHEPRLALDGGADGLACYRSLLPAAAARSRIAVLVEIGHDQAEAVSGLAQSAGLQSVRVHQDLGGNARVVEGLCST